jgi:hypothetical protein
MHRRSRPTLEVLEDRLAPAIVLGQQPGAPNTTQFHGDAARTGFNQNETFLTPANVASSFGQVWQSPVLDGHLYASPLYQDGILIQGNGNAANHSGDGVQSPSFQGKTLGIVFAATGGGTVYAIAAQDTNGPTGVAPGTILWKTHLGNPYGSIDGDSVGVLGTPIIDVAGNRIYVTASVTDYLLPAGNPNHGANNWEVFALNLNDGSLVPGWPLAFTQSLLDALNQNKLNGGHAVPFSSSGGDQRGALALSPDGSTLYVDFAAYGTSNPGWMTTVATGVSNGLSNGQTPAVMSAYSGVDSTTATANAGMWGAGGPAVDANGNVFVSTGDSPNGTGQTPGAWGNSVLEWGPGQVLNLTGAYSPWNYQTQDTIDSDLGGGSPILIQFPGGSSTTTEVLAVGGKQGNGYLVDAGNHLNNPTRNANNSLAPFPASLTSRPPVVSPNQDPSLYDPSAIRSYFNPPQAGPLALFGPYNETSASGNTAKARDTPATFTGPDGTRYVIWAGSSKAAVGSSTPVAPSLYLTKVVASPGQPAFLRIVAQNTQVMSLAGANIITADGTADPVEWILDAGVQRTDGLTSFANGAPTLYAYDALTLQPLWSSSYKQLDMGGKYNTIAAARGVVFVGTDRIQAFGLTNDTIVDDSVQGTGSSQFTYVGTGWTHTPAGTSIATMGTFDGTVSTDNVSGDYATMTFSGSQIKVYANEASGYGSVTISVDGGNAKTVSLANTTNSPNGQGEGDVLVYTLPALGAGIHTLKVVNNGNSTVAFDRVEITPLPSSSSALGVSLTEGNVAPVLGQVLPYTINYNNAGSIIDSTGTNAGGVVLTETVAANTTADLANSTPGWRLTSGSGGPGSTYSFVVGSLTAGATGSVVFSVDVNNTVPAGTINVVNTVILTDAASDSTSATRVSPLGSPIPRSLTFTQQPGNGLTGVPLTPAVTVAMQDQFGNTYAADSSSSVTLTLNGGTFANGSTTATATVSGGVASFSNLVFSAPGNYTLTATDGNLISATSTAFQIQSSSAVFAAFVPTAGVLAISEMFAAASRPGTSLTISGNTGSGGGVSSLVTVTGGLGTTVNGASAVTITAAFPGAISAIYVNLLNDNDSLTIGTPTGIVNLPSTALTVTVGGGNNTFVMGSAGSATVSAVNNVLNGLTWKAANPRSTGVESASILNAAIGSVSISENSGPGDSIQLWGVTVPGSTTLMQNDGPGDSVSVDQLNATNPGNPGPTVTLVPSVLGTLWTAQGTGNTDTTSVSRTAVGVSYAASQGNGAGDGLFLGSGDTVGMAVGSVYGGPIQLTQGTGSGDYLGLANLQAGATTLLQQDASANLTGDTVGGVSTPAIPPAGSSLASPSPGTIANLVSALNFVTPIRAVPTNGLAGAVLEQLTIIQGAAGGDLVALVQLPSGATTGVSLSVVGGSGIPGALSILQQDLAGGRGDFLFLGSYTPGSGTFSSQSPPFPYTPGTVGATGSITALNEIVTQGNGAGDVLSVLFNTTTSSTPQPPSLFTQGNGGDQAIFQVDSSASGGEFDYKGGSGGNRVQADSNRVTGTFDGGSSVSNNHLFWDLQAQNPDLLFVDFGDTSFG